MVVFNPSKREIGAKIVYYGPARCGKTTNLQYIHKKLSPKQRGNLVSLATKDDRTLFFDFLPLDLGTVKGFKTRFHLYTVPGQVYYVSTRRAVLTGVDGVVFVADSQEEKLAENIESLEDLEKNLLFYGKKVEEIPMVLQYNKVDMENLSTIEELNEKLNKRNLPFLKATAITGKGVVETLTMVSKAVLESLEDSSRKPKTARKPKAAAEQILKPKPAAPKVPTPPPQEPESSLIELSAGDEVKEIEKLKAERRATIDKLLIPEEPLELSEEPMELEPSSGASEELGVDETLEFEGAEELDDDLEVDVSLEAGVPEEEIQPEVEEGLLELETSEEEFELEEEELPLAEPEGLEAQREIEKPEISEQPPQPELAPKVGGIEIMSCGEPKKISPASVKFPLVVRLKEIDKEAKITITVQLDDLIIK